MVGEPVAGVLVDSAVVASAAVASVVVAGVVVAGVVVASVPDGESVLDAAVTLAEKITVNAPLAVQASKRVACGADAGTITAEQGSWERSNREMSVVFGSADAMEGPLAFAEKRPPVWKAR